MLQSGRERGAILGMTIIFALAAAIMSYGMLAISMAQARQAKFYRTSNPARFASEAALVWAQQNLIANPRWPYDPSTNPTGIQTAFVEGGVTVDVTVTPACTPVLVPVPPCPSRRIEAKAQY